MLDVLKQQKIKKEEIPKSQIDIKKIQEHIMAIQKPKDRKQKADVVIQKPSKSKSIRTRRPNGAGAVYFRNYDQRWCGRVKLGVDPITGKDRNKHVYGHSQDEVIKKMAKIKNNIMFYESEYASTNKVGKLMKEWLLLFKKNTVTSRTFDGIIRNYRLHIEPFIGELKLNEVDKYVVQVIINKMHEKNYAICTIKKVKQTIGQFFEYAIENEWVLRNPTNNIKIRNVNKQPKTTNKYKAVEPEFRSDLLKQLDQEEYSYLRPLCKLLMFGGLRIGEALALNWKDIDFDNKIVNVEKGMTENYLFDDDGNAIKREIIIGTTKTMCSVRQVPAPSIVFEELKLWQEFQESKNNPKVIGRNAWVFAHDDGSFMNYDHVKKKYDKFKKQYEEELKGVGFHGLRHTFSNMLFEMHENPKAIQQLLGHKDVKTTIMVYNSVNSAYVKGTTANLEEKINTTLLNQENSL